MSKDYSSTTNTIIKKGISLGSALAIVISWSVNKSILWAIFHGFLSWLNQFHNHAKSFNGYYILTD